MDITELAKFGAMITVLSNARLMLIAFIIFMILVVVIRRTDIYGRRKLGNIMLGFSIPGGLVLIIYVVLFILCYIAYHQEFENGMNFEGGISDIVRTYMGISGDLVLISMIIVLIYGIVSAIIGMLMLKNGYGTSIGVIALTIGGIFAVLSTLLFFPVLAGMSY